MAFATDGAKNHKAPLLSEDERRTERWSGLYDLKNF
jgi:hypothetical protein